MKVHAGHGEADRADRESLTGIGVERIEVPCSPYQATTVCHQDGAEILVSILQRRNSIGVLKHDVHRTGRASRRCAGDLRIAHDVDTGAGRPTDRHGVGARLVRGETCPRQRQQRTAEGGTPCRLNVRQARRWVVSEGVLQRGRPTAGGHCNIDDPWRTRWAETPDRGRAQNDDLGGRGAADAYGRTALEIGPAERQLSAAQSRPLRGRDNRENRRWRRAVTAPYRHHDEENDSPSQHLKSIPSPASHLNIPYLTAVPP